MVLKYILYFFLFNRFMMHCKHETRGHASVYIVTLLHPQSPYAYVDASGS